ncbi:MAG: hypothetical protein ACOY0T_05695 [Myxococcota bacterium]
MTRQPDLTPSAKDATFERLLLDSARDDALPSAGPAFQRFSAALAAVATAGTVNPELAVRAVRRLAMKWSAIGAVAGSAATALWFGYAAAPRANAPQASAAAAKVAVLATSPPLAMGPSRTPEDSAPRASTAPGASLPLQTRKPRAATHTSGISDDAGRASAAGASAASSSLLAEVALLDAVRAKLALHDGAGALQLLAGYQRKFPRGQLASDAAALSIEAFAAEGNRAEVQRRAASFLERTPNDPHAERVRGLAEQP